MQKLAILQIVKELIIHIEIRMCKTHFFLTYECILDFATFYPLNVKSCEMMTSKNMLQGLSWSPRLLSHGYMYIIVMRLGLGHCTMTLQYYVACVHVLLGS